MGLYLEVTDVFRVLTYVIIWFIYYFFYIENDNSLNAFKTLI